MLARRKTMSGRIALFVLIAAATALVATGDALAAKTSEPKIEVRQGTSPIARGAYASSDEYLRVKVTSLQPKSEVCLFIDGEPYGVEKSPKKHKDAVKFSVDCSVGPHKAQARVRHGQKDRWSPIVQFHVVNRPRKPEVLALISHERRFMASEKGYWVDGPRFDAEVTVPDFERGDRVVAYKGTSRDPIGEATLETEPTARISLDLGRDTKRHFTFRVYRGGIRGKRSDDIKVRVPESLPTAAMRRQPLLSGAFAVLPQVRAVPTGDEAGINKPAAQKPENPKGFTFDRPAHFPLPEFGRDGEPIDHLGLVIYEGMRFAVDKKGHYTVRFLASAPAMPVELRLQFFVVDKDKSCWVTLPPIRLPEKKPAKVEEGAYLVEHEGYLSNSIGSAGYAVQRWGTARFGHGLIDGP